MSGSSSAGALRVPVTADIAQFQQSMDRVRAMAEQTMSGINRASAGAAGAQAQLSQATDAAARALGVAAKAAVALGVAFAGMKLSEAVKDATTSAARFETMGVVLGRLSQNTKFSAVEIEKFATGVQSMGITMTGSREVIARMIQAQINLSDATKLARVAQDAAVIGNINSSEALERLTYGIQSAQVEVLRTLGLNVSFEQSYERLAESLNKPVAALTELEKTQARTNAALQAGASIVGAYEASMETAGKQLLSMERLIADLSVNVGNIFLPAFTSAVFQLSDLIKRANAALESPSGRAAVESIGAALKSVADNATILIEAIAIGIGVTMVAALARAAVAAGSLGAILGGVGGAIAGHLGLAFTAVTATIAFFALKQSEVARDQALITQALAANEAATRKVTSATNELSAAQKLQMENAQRAALASAKAKEAELAAAVARAQTFVAEATIPGGARSRFSQQQMDAEPQADDKIVLQIARWQAALQQFAQSDKGTEALGVLSQKMAQLSGAIGTGNAAWNNYISDYEQAIQRIVYGTVALEEQRAAIDRLNAARAAPGAPAFDLAGSQAAITKTLDALNLKQVGLNIMPEEFQKALTLLTAITDHMDRLKAAYGQVQVQLGDMEPNTAQWNAKLAEAQGIASQIGLLIGNWPGLMAATRAATSNVFDPWAGEGEDPNKPRTGGGGGNGLAEAKIRAEWAQKIAEAEAQGAFHVRQAAADMEKLIAASKGGVAVAEALAKAREAEAAAIGKALADARILHREAEQGLALSLAQLEGPIKAAQVAREQERARLIREVGPNQPGVVAAGVGAFDASQAQRAAEAMAQIGIEAQKATALAQIEMGLIGASNSERERAVQLEQLRLQYVEAIAKAGGNEAVIAQIQAIYDKSVASVNALGAVKAQLEETQRIQDALKQAGDAIGQAFEQAVLKGGKLTDVLKSLEQALLSIFLKQFIFKPITDMLGNLGGGGLLGGLFSGIGSLFGGGSATSGVNLSQAGSGAIFLEHGGMPNARGLGAYSNSFVHSPTVFPFAKGAVGLMGEAGTEAIFPVIRTKSGDFGVRAVNDNGGGGAKEPKVEVNVYAPAGSTVKQERQKGMDKETLNFFIDNAVANNMARGSRTHARLRDNFGAQQQLIAR